MVAHTFVRPMDYFILTDRGRVSTRTTVQHPMETEVKNTEVQQLIRYYHVRMHGKIGAAVVIDTCNDKVLIYNDDLRDPIKSNDGVYYVFEKNVDMDEVVDCTSTET